MRVVVRHSGAGFKTGSCVPKLALGGGPSYLRASSSGKRIRIELVAVRPAKEGDGRCAPGGSGPAGRLGGWWRRCAGEVLRLLDELAEPLDGLLVGAEVVAVQGLLGASVLLGLLLEDPRQGG